MSKSKKPKSSSKGSEAPKTVEVTQQEAPTLDAGLAALFASSAGPVTVPQRPARVVTKSIKTPEDVNGSGKALIVQETEQDDSTGESSSVESEGEVDTQPERPRKRRRVDANEDLESKYMNKLVREEEQEQELKQKQKELQDQNPEAEDQTSSDGNDSDSDLNSELPDLSDSDAEIYADDDDQEGENEDKIPQHETVAGTAHEVEAEKTRRTVFLGNVSTSVIRSKSAKKALVLHLRSAIDVKHHEKIESIRFRSTAFVADAGPKRAAYAKKEIMDETMKSTNAYAVMSSEAAARKVAAKLNGSTVLDRHLRADNLGAPSPVDHKRCVFVGNLSFVDEAMNPPGGDSEKSTKRAKNPADVEEGLWRSFGKCGKVESVRVVRDKETRISKGFAYVQFADENAVESALLLDGKKFPPMLPRLLRVSRAKREMKKDRRDKQGPSSVGRRGAGTKRSFSARNEKSGSRPQAGKATGGKAVLEGHRASSGSIPKGLKKIVKRAAVKPTNRSAKRAAAFKAGHGKKKRDLA